MKITIDDYVIRPKARVRHTGRGIFTPTSRSENSLALILRTKATQKIDGCLSVRCIQELTGKAPGDIDNIIKTLLDAMQKAGIVKNDRSVKKCECYLLENSPTNRVTIEICEL